MRKSVTRPGRVEGAERGGPDPRGAGRAAPGARGGTTAARARRTSLEGGFPGARGARRPAVRPRGARSRALLAATVALLSCAGEEGLLELPGSVERTLVEVSSPHAETLVEVAVRRGARVARGDLLARLDPTLAHADLAAAEAGVLRARARLAVAEHDHRRAVELRKREVASEQQLERARLALDEARALLREAVAREHAARKRLDDTILLAPVDGTVDQLPFDLGERVPAGAVVAVLLADEAPFVRVWIPETAAASLAPGTPAQIHVDGIDRALRGRVLDVAREPEYTPHFALTERERVHLVYEARVAVEDAPPELRPGLPAEVRLPRPGAPRP